MATYTPLEDWTHRDLEALVENAVPEGRTLDYKLSVGGSDADRREFLADVSSFANAVGGDLLVGVKAKKGIAIELAGLPTEAADDESLRLDNIIRDGIEPRLPRVEIRPAPTAEGATRVVLALRVPRSWAAPHMVTYRAHSRFYSRNSAGKYPMDVAEIRASVVLSETAADRVRAFREDRVRRVADGATPVEIPTNPCVVLHLVPMAAFDPGSRFGLDHLSSSDSLRLIGPIYRTTWTHRYNFDGYLSYTPSDTPGQALTYLQVFRNGIIEAVEASMLSRSDEIPSTAFEQELIRALRRYLQLQREIGVQPPLFLMLSLLHVRGFTMRVNPARGFSGDTPIDREHLIVPEVLVDDLTQPAERSLRAAFDAVWNATGWPRSINYDQEGNWNPDR